jgi:exodeoxyribonuclease V alpha subunit
MDDLQPLDLFFAGLHQPRSENEKLFFAALMASAREGHLCLDLDRSDPAIQEGATTALQSPYIRRQGRLVYLERNFTCEKQIVEDLKRLTFSVQPPSFSTDGLTDEQRTAVEIALSNTLSVIEGGPGTGKTFLTSYLVKAIGANVILAAPTGKAAARLKKFNPAATCSTLHAMLGISSRKRSGYVKADLIIVDESSMIDAKLLAYFLRSLQTGQRVVFLGDGHQLPPIESGSLFTDLVDLLPTAHLRQCLRSDRAEILQLAQDILAGKTITPDHPLSVDLLLNAKETAILTPLREGPWGVNHLNELIFQHVKKEAPELWSVPILITKTDYEAGLYNGEMGVLWRTHVKPLYAEFEDGRKIAASALPPYELGYVLSVHKSQGSEFDRVIVLAPPGTETFGRELLYTAVTRARNSVILCGDPETIQKTVSRSNQRNSGLKCLNSSL